MLKQRKSREGVIIKCPLIHLFHDARDIILTSRNDVWQLDDDDDDDDDKPTLGILSKEKLVYIFSKNNDILGKNDGF